MEVPDLLSVVSASFASVDEWLRGGPLFPGFMPYPGWCTPSTRAHHLTAHTGEECAAEGACYEPTRVIAFSLAIHAFVVTSSSDPLHSSHCCYARIQFVVFYFGSKAFSAIRALKHGDQLYFASVFVVDIVVDRGYTSGI